MKLPWLWTQTLSTRCWLYQNRRPVQQEVTRVSHFLRIQKGWTARAFSALKAFALENTAGTSRWGVIGLSVWLLEPTIKPLGPGASTYVTAMSGCMSSSQQTANVVEKLYLKTCFPKRSECSWIMTKENWHFSTWIGKKIYTPWDSLSQKRSFRIFARMQKSFRLKCQWK